MEELHLLESQFAYVYCKHFAELGKRIYSGPKTDRNELSIASYYKKLTDVWFYSKNLKERIRALVIFLIMRDVGDDTTIDSEECTEIEFPEELPEDFPGEKKRIVKTENIFIAFNAISLLFPEEEDAMMKNFLLPLKLKATEIFLDKLGKLLDKPTMTKTDKGTAKELIWKLKLIYSNK